MKFWPQRPRKWPLNLSGLQRPSVFFLSFFLNQSWCDLYVCLVVNLYKFYNHNNCYARHLRPLRISDFKNTVAWEHLDVRIQGREEITVKKLSFNCFSWNLTSLLTLLLVLSFGSFEKDSAAMLVHIANKVIIRKSREEQFLWNRIGLVLDRLAVLKTAQPSYLWGQSFLCFLWQIFFF